MNKLSPSFTTKFKSLTNTSAIKNEGQLVELNLRSGIDSKSISNYSIFSTGLFFLAQPETPDFQHVNWEKTFWRLTPKLFLISDSRWKIQITSDIPVKKTWLFHKNQ